MANEKAEDAGTEVEEVLDETTQGTELTKPEAELDKEAEGDEVTVSIAGVSPNPEEDAADAPAWVKDLRQRYKATTKRNQELEEQLKNANPSNKAIEVGVKPTLESCEFDGEKFEKELLSWNNRKQKAEADVAAKAKDDAEIQKAWETKQRDYETAKSNLKVKDYPDAEDFVKDNFSVVQQGIIIKGSKDAAIVVYALGKNSETAKKLAAIKDPIDFAFAVARLEGTLKVTAKTAPSPEKKPSTSGGNSNSGVVNKELERLRAEAEKTGNYTKVIAYKRQLKK